MKEDLSPKVKFISEKFVRPKHEVEASKQLYYLNPIDLGFFSLDQMQKGLLFSTKPNDIHSDLLDKLEMSLAISLIHFFHLSGRLVTEQFPDEHAIWVYVDCNKGPGARIIHAAVDIKVHDIVSSIDVPLIVRSFFDLGERAVNYDGHTRPLLSMQVTELVDGVFIGFTMNHSTGDGTNLWHFISMLSEIFSQLESNCENDDETNSISISRKPIYQPFVFDGYGPIFKLPYLEPNEFVVRFDPGRLRERIFHFSAESLSMLKIKANQYASLNNELAPPGDVSDTKISSFQALCGLLWLSIMRARKLRADQKTSCTFTISSRARLEPPIPEDLLGNYLAGAQASCTVGELLANDYGWAASFIHQTLAKQDDKSIREFVGKYAKSPSVGQTGSSSAFYEPNSVLIAGSARFDMYGPQFGLGRAVAVLAGYANKDDGKVTANPGHDGKGSVALEVCLKPETMDALELDQEFMSFVSN